MKSKIKYLFVFFIPALMLFVAVVGLSSTDSFATLTLPDWVLGLTACAMISLFAMGTLVYGNNGYLADKIGLR
ncbi:hypothetical protein [Neptuniibacter sp. QD37_11]|uniref:hypothetical protein n=1 Tax=Neptuniibacter sp. QD37_11 TaxID=3398209 RepID=UPI0039F518F0